MRLATGLPLHLPSIVLSSALTVLHLSGYFTQFRVSSAAIMEIRMCCSWHASSSLFFSLAAPHTLWGNSPPNSRCSTLMEAHDFMVSLVCSFCLGPTSHGQGVFGYGCSGFRDGACTRATQVAQFCWRLTACSDGRSKDVSLSAQANKHQQTSMLNTST